MRVCMVVALLFAKRNLSSLSLSALFRFELDSTARSGHLAAQLFGLTSYWTLAVFQNQELFLGVQSFRPFKFQVL